MYINYYINEAKRYLALIALLIIWSDLHGDILSCFHDNSFAIQTIKADYTDGYFTGFAFNTKPERIKDKRFIAIIRTLDNLFDSTQKCDTVYLLQCFDKTHKTIGAEIWSRDKRFEIAIDKAIIVKPKSTIQQDSPDFYCALLEHSFDNLISTISTWNLRSIAEMLLYSGSCPNALGTLEFHRMIIENGDLREWQRLIFYRVYYWQLPDGVDARGVVKYTPFDNQIDEELKRQKGYVLEKLKEKGVSIQSILNNIDP